MDIAGTTDTTVKTTENIYRPISCYIHLWQTILILKQHIHHSMSL